jgi:hypothetical protein
MGIDPEKGAVALSNSNNDDPTAICKVLIYLTARSSYMLQGIIVAHKISGSSNQHLAA